MRGQMWCFQLVLSSVKINGIFFKWRPVKHELKVQIFPCLLFSIHLFFGGLVTITFVDILKVGGVDKATWQKSYRPFFLKSVWINGFALHIYYSPASERLINTEALHNTYMYKTWPKQKLHCSTFAIGDYVKLVFKIQLCSTFALNNG